MDCFQTITWIVTNECKFGCHYCKFANRDVAEASLEAKLGALDVMASWPDADKRFICLLGGDILFMPGVVDFVKKLNGLGLPYGFQTSASDYELMEKVAPWLRNFSISVDPVPHGDMSRWKKGLWGIYWAGRLREQNQSIDVHATITVDRHNYRFVPDTVKMLSDMGIWVEITLVHWHKLRFDFVPAKVVVGGFEPDDVPGLLWMVDMLCDMKSKGAKVHSSVEFLSMIPKYAVELDWKCPKPVNLVLDVDLSVRECLHLPGKRVREYSVFDLKSGQGWEKFMGDWKKDQDELCPKCLWDCQYEAAVGSQDKVDGWFSHRG